MSEAVGEETAKDLLSAARRTLEDNGNPSAMLDARLLLEHAAAISRESLIADPGRKLPAEAVLRFRDAMKRRLAGEPVSRIVGEREFYGRSFKLTPATLDPRPDTETLVEAALALIPRDARVRIIDLGTGSGAIAVTILAERPLAQAVMTDISGQALAVARGNARRHGVEARASFFHGSWFAGSRGRYDLILSNPPYIPRAIVDTLAPEVRNFDPLTALCGGADGLDAYREIARQSDPNLAPGGWVIVEIGQGQGAAAEGIFASKGWHTQARYSDLGGRLRCLRFGRAEATEGENVSRG